MAESKDQESKLHIDSDWKAQAQAEKQRLAEEAKAKPEAGAAAGAGAAAPGALPEASLETLVHSLATQALLAMGAIADPRTGQRYNNMDVARHHVDTLQILEEKTKGNLSDEESQMLSTILYELRNRYIQLATAARGR